MNIKQYKEFKKDFTFTSPLDEKALLDTVRKNTRLQAVTLTCNAIEGRLLDSNRSKHDKEAMIILAYVIYLCSFTSGIYQNFDSLVEWIAKNTLTYVNEVTMREVLSV